MGKVEYRYVIGRHKRDLERVLNKLKKRGFAVRWDHLAARYNVRRRVNNEEVHIIIREQDSKWVAMLHIDVIRSDFPTMVHKMSYDSNKIEYWGTLLFGEDKEERIVKDKMMAAIRNFQIHENIIPDLILEDVLKELPKKWREPKNMKKLRQILEEEIEAYKTNKGQDTS